MESPLRSGAIWTNYRVGLMDWFVWPYLGGVVLSFIFCPECVVEGRVLRLFELSLVNGTFWTVLSNGNRILVHQLDRRWNWISQPILRSILGLISMFIFTAIAATLIIFFYVEFVLDFRFMNLIEKQGWLETVDEALIITLIISLFMHGRGFLFAWREAAIDVEKLKNQNLMSQYESLKNQVNPHFLFNSLNALSSLVYSDQDKAVEFIRKLSDVYRYVLDHQFDEVVPLKMEMGFVDSFIYLNKIRFGDNLNVEVIGKENITEEDQIPPLSLQMLLENAFKHNVVSRKQNLNVKIEFANQHISVVNNLNPKQEQEESSGVGLKNIKKRYAFLSDQKVDIQQDEQEYTVKIPILKMKN